MKIVTRLSAAVLALACSNVVRAEPVLKNRDTVAVLGDSITEQKLYSVYIETYLLACKPKADLKINQFGWSGETAPGLLARIGTDVLPLHPTIATTCYGMNDGHYVAMSSQTGDTYRAAMKGILEALKKGGVRTVVVGGPGAVDTDTYKNRATSAAVYNDTLAALSDIAKDLAKENHYPFADVHGEMIEVMQAAKAKYGKDFAFAGGDGVHPSQAGHLVMAYTYLKAMGCDGNLGTITLDLAGNHNTASEGHRIVSAENSSVTIESTRMPFCFIGDGKSASSDKSVADLCPFNADLNRLTLIVKNAGSGQVKVTWGSASKTFSADQLSKGINLAAEFEDDNPFATAFNELKGLVYSQQIYETMLTKNWLHNVNDFRKSSPDVVNAVDQVNTDSLKLDQVMFDAAAKKAAKPVTHTIKIEPG